MAVDGVNDSGLIIGADFDPAIVARSGGAERDTGLAGALGGVYFGGGKLRSVVGDPYFWTCCAVGGGDAELGWLAEGPNDSGPIIGADLDPNIVERAAGWADAASGVFGAGTEGGAEDACSTAGCWAVTADSVKAGADFDPAIMRNFSASDGL